MQNWLNLLDKDIEENYSNAISKNERTTYRIRDLIRIISHTEGNHTNHTLIDIVIRYWTANVCECAKIDAKCE